MNIKKEVINNIKKKLVKDQTDLQWEIDKNKLNINRLSDNQEVMKRQKAKLGELIRSLEG